MTSVLYSSYVIDGAEQELTPAQLLDSCLVGKPAAQPDTAFTPIVDESIDPFIRPCVTETGKIDEYLRMVLDVRAPRKAAQLPFVDFYTRQKIALRLLEAIWRKGHFKLGNLALTLDWKWDSGQIGALASFYASASAASDYIDALGIRLKTYSYSETPGRSTLSVRASVLREEGPEEEIEEENSDPKLSTHRARPAKFLNDESAWIVYVPFDDGKFRLGGSKLAAALGVSGEGTPQLLDADYFIDCYEVVREMVEDGVALTGVTVGEGGLMAALQNMTEEGVGAEVDLGSLIHATGEKDIVRLLFAELPGVVMQIADNDYDYVDAEFLLQDVAFFPLGHVRRGRNGVQVKVTDQSPVSGILESILRSQSSSEGED
jgi:hypothetical protein